MQSSISLESVAQECNEIHTTDGLLYQCNHGVFYNAEVLETYICPEGNPYEVRRSMPEMTHAYIHWLNYHTLPMPILEKSRASAQMGYELKKVHTVMTGGHFGEMQFLKEDRSNLTRAARIVTLADTHFAIIKKDDYDKCLRRVAMKA